MSKPLKIHYINDDVMGGNSTCSYKPHELPDGTKCNAYRGFVSEENNGGFSSVRFDTSGSSDFSQATGVMIKATSENEAHKDAFQFFIRDRKCQQFMATNWKIGFSASREGVYIPFKSLELESFGRPLQGSAAWPMDLNNIVEMGFYAKKSSGIIGDFCLYVHDLALSNKPKD
eukprot:gene1093-1030_t